MKINEITVHVVTVFFLLMCSILAKAALFVDESNFQIQYYNTLNLGLVIFVPIVSEMVFLNRQQRRTPSHGKLTISFRPDDLKKRKHGRCWKRTITCK